MGSLQGGLRESVAGGPAYPVGAEGLALSWLPPFFEPGGGFGKAFFYEFPPPSSVNTVIGNEDGAGHPRPGLR